MELSDLEIFKAVAEEGGIVRASRRLDRVPSNVTTRVKHLESAVGAQLFVRSGRRLAIAQAGKVLLGYADRLLHLAEEARRSVASHEVAGRLRLGALESISASRLPALLARFHTLHAAVRVELVTGTNDALTLAVARRELDTAFVVERPSERSFAAHPAFTERLVVISSARHAPIGSARDVGGDAVIAFPDGCAYRRVLLRWLGRERVACTPVFELASYHAIVACVAAGTGIAMVPESVLDAMRIEGITRHALPGVLAQRTTRMIWRAGEESTTILALRDLLTATVADAGGAARLARRKPAGRSLSVRAGGG